jgi:exodeoxyribonuclease V gamma subunit
VLGHWLDSYEAAGGHGPARRVCFGRAREHGIVDELLEPIRLDVEGKTVELYGDVHPLAEIGSVLLVNGRAADQKYPIRACVDHVVLAAAGFECGERAAIVARREAAPRRFRLAPWTQVEARAYLANIVGELIGQPHEYLLPCEAVFRYLKDPKVDVRRVIAAMRDQPRQHHSGAYGPVDRFKGLGPPDDAVAMIERRFRPLVDRCEEIDG